MNGLSSSVDGTIDIAEASGKAQSKQQLELIEMNTVLAFATFAYSVTTQGARMWPGCVRGLFP